MIHDHIMVIGGTGMLKNASIVLAGRCEHLTSVARTSRSLAALNKEIHKKGIRHSLLQLDWNSSDFLDELVSYINRKTCPALVVAWLHRDSLGFALATRLSEICTNEIIFYQIFGSAAAHEPATSNTVSSTLDSSVQIRSIILGYVIEDGTSRWLTNTEISAGVIASIDSGKERSIVGTVDPWSERP